MDVWVYARVSQDRSGAVRSPTEQAAASQAWADREGWTVTRTVIETGSASRYARKDRPEWAQVMRAIQNRDMDALLTWESSRATRDLTAYAELRDACAANGVKWGYHGTLHDLTVRDSRFRTGLDALLAEDESARTSERVKRNIMARAAAGKPHGKIPYGYRREYDPQSGELLRQVPDETTAPVVRRMYAEALAGRSCHGIAVALNNDGIPTARPSKWGWRSPQVLVMLKSPTYLGKRVHQGEVVADADWPALVDDDTWWAVQGKLAEPRQKRPDTTVKYLLSGIARCGATLPTGQPCTGPMYAQNVRGYPTYVCANGQHLGRSMRLLDAYVTDRLLALLTEVTLPESDNHAAAEARLELDALNARLTSFTTAAADGTLSPLALAKVEQSLAPKIADAEAALRQASIPHALAGVDLSDPAGMWATADLERKRHLLRNCLTVTVLPAQRGARSIKPGTVEIKALWAT